MKIITIYIIILSFLYSKDNDWDETLMYSAYFSGIHVANATLKSKRTFTLENQDILNIEFKAHSRSRSSRLIVGWTMRSSNAGRLPESSSVPAAPMV